MNGWEKHCMERDLLKEGYKEVDIFCMTEEQLLEAWKKEFIRENV